MEHREGKSKVDRREIRSVCMPVPTIVLNSSAAKNNETTLSHSRSAGDLDMVLSDTDDYQASGKSDGTTLYSGTASSSMHDGGHSRSAIGLYCSPRMLRRSGKGQEECPHQNRHSGLFIESLNACSLNCLDPGSRVGSTVSLNSEYTSRSVGLISNDSNSECSQNLYQSGVTDSSFLKHNVLKRFYSTPEKDDDVINYQTHVRRNSKSMGNMQKEDMHNYVSFDFGSDSTDDNPRHFENSQSQGQTESCDIDTSLAWRTSASGDDNTKDDGGTSGESQNLVKAVTGSSAMRDSRIRKWLVEIRDPRENSSNS